MLQQLAPVTAQLQSSHGPGSNAHQSSLLDVDMGMTKSMPSADSATSQQGGTRSKQGLDAGAKAWAAQLALLVMQAYMVLADDDLPEWISCLINDGAERDLLVGMACLCNANLRK